MNKFFLYTETAFHHEGDLAYAKELILASKRAGAQGIKFQVLIETSAFLSTQHSGYVALSKYCFTLDQWSALFELASSEGLEIILMPLDLRSLELGSRFKVKFIDIHPVSFYDMPLLEAVKATNIPVILGVGGRSVEEINKAVEFFGGQLSVLMVGFQAFPSDLKDVKLKRIPLLKELFPLLHIGYADHSAYNHEHAIISNEYARLFGATIFEKHITLEEGKERVDFSAAVSEQKIASIIQRLRIVEDQVLGDPKTVFDFTPAEEKYRQRQKKVVLVNSLPAGTVLRKEHLTTKMIDKEGGFYTIDSLIDKKLLEDLEFDVMIEHKSLEQ